MVVHSNWSDQDLVLLLREGNEKAFTEIYNRYKWLLHTHAYKKVGDRDLANDIVQELFTNLWIKRKDIFVATTLTAYLFTAIRNRILNIIEHRIVESNYIDSIVNYAKTFVSGTDHLIREQQFMRIIEREIAALPAKMRAVFELSRKGGLTHKEIAEQLQISEQTVTRQIKNALKILRSRLGFVLLAVLLIRYLLK